MTGPGGVTPAEQHLGDHLAALVDGELGHEARERVLAHLATCPKCKAEADAQRELKNVFAEAAPPPPSEGLLARLQGLPGGEDGPGGPFGGGGSRLGGVFGARSPASFGYLPAVGHGAPAPAAGGTRGGFRVHEVDRSSRGRRFAFAAAGAVSVAAIALGGALPSDGPADSPGARAEGAGATARTAPGAGGGAPREAGAPVLAEERPGLPPEAAAPPASSAPAPTSHVQPPLRSAPPPLPTGTAPVLLVRQVIPAARVAPEPAATASTAPAPTQSAVPSGPSNRAAPLLGTEAETRHPAR